MSIMQNSMFGSPEYFCERCGRALSNPISMLAHRGPVCRHRGQTEAMNKSEPTDYRIENPIEDGLVLERTSTSIGTNCPHLVTHHSPTGFEFGYAGSGPADLALNMCELLLNKIHYTGDRVKCWDGDCFELAFQLHQEFKWKFIDPANRNGDTIPYAMMLDWVKSKAGID